MTEEGAGDASLAALAIWSAMPAGMVAEFHDWHNIEHVPERMALPGFLGVRRYHATEAPATFFTLYDLADMDALDSPAYRAVLAGPTEWTRRVIAAQFDGARALARRRFARVRAIGSELAVWRLADGECSATRLDAICRDVLPPIGARDDVAAVTLLVTDKARTGGAATGAAAINGFSVPGAVLLLEGWSGIDRLHDAANALATAAMLGAPARFHRLEAIASSSPR